MANREKLLFVFGLLVVVFLGDDGVSAAGEKNATNKGVCTLEVQTIDLLSDDDKLGVIPQGNGSRPGFSKIQVCCSGYQRAPHTWRKCEPICENGCENGNCTAPNVCVCWKGYLKDQKGACVATCPIGCSHGICKNGECVCNKGYVLDQSGKLCIPHCPGGCGIGGECVAPDTCECGEGFIKNPRSHKCEYFCEGGCPGGTCIGPNQCSCKEGYTLQDKACVASCPKGCKNGICTAPNQCSCKAGWTLDESGAACQAHCNSPCLNGECTGPDQCTCRKGYIADPTSANGSRCVAHCPDGCENGVCSGPNFCICNTGYVKESRGSNKCIKRERRSVMHYELIPEQHNDY